MIKKDLKPLNINLDKAISAIEENSITGKVSATGYLGNCLGDIIKFTEGCQTFEGNVTFLKEVRDLMESPYTLYAKALVLDGFKSFESTSFLETAVASYRNDEYF